MSIREIEVKAGETIVEQGAPGEGLYILRSGVVEVHKNGLLLNVLTFPNTVFGEMGDILGRPRTCTVKARSDCQLLYYSPGSLEQLIQEEPQLALRIIKTLASRLERTTAKLAEQFQEPAVWSVPRKTETI